MTLTPALDEIVAATIGCWPEHALFLEKSITPRSEYSLLITEQLSKAILKIVGTELAGFCLDYRKTCERLTEEEWFFRRNDGYRFSRYVEVADFVYHNPEFMRSYIRGLLISQVLWKNHAETMAYYRRNFVETIPASGRHLEIGPGHGLSMHLAMSVHENSLFEGWDISETSLTETRHCLMALGHDESMYKLLLNDASRADEGSDAVVADRYDSVTISEVLEHTESPATILAALQRLISKQGRIFVNIPINSPAPDHIFLFRSPEEVWALAHSGGFDIESHHEFPLTGYNLEKAMKLKATVSCAMILKKA